MEPKTDLPQPPIQEGASPTPDQPKPPENQPEQKVLRVGDFVNRLQELESHPLSGAKWKATKYPVMRPTFRYPMSPNAEDHIEGEIEEQLIEAQARPENPRQYSTGIGWAVRGHRTSYVEGEEMIQRVDVTRDDKGDIEGIGYFIDYSRVYNEPQQLPYGGREKMGERIILNMRGDVSVRSIIIEDWDDTGAKSFGEVETALYDRNDPKGKEIIKRIYDDLDASIDHSAVPPLTQPAPSGTPPAPSV